MPQKRTASECIDAGMGRPTDLAQSANVCFGSKADIDPLSSHVRFTPESGHCRLQLGCPLCANSGHQSLTGRFSLRQELCRILSIVKPVPSALWLVPMTTARLERYCCPC